MTGRGQNAGRRQIALVSAMALAAVVAPAFADYREVAVSAGGTIRGRVRLSGEVPQITSLPTGKDEAICGKEQPNPRLVAGTNGGVANAVVYLEEAASGKAFDRKPAMIDQKGCRYDPHVLIVPVSPQIGITNSDTVLHNVHACTADAERRTLFNVAQPLVGQETPISAERLATPGFYSLSCEAGHPWMSGYLVVAAHPYYALTGPDGEYTIDRVPPGRYVLRLWHEGVRVTNYSASMQRYDYEAPYEQSKPVEVKAGGEARVDFELTLRPPGGERTAAR